MEHKQTDTANIYLHSPNSEQLFHFITQCVFFLISCRRREQRWVCVSSDGPVSVNDLQVYCTLLKMSDNLQLSCCSQPYCLNTAQLVCVRCSERGRHLLMTQGQKKTQLIISCWAFHSRCWRSEGISSLTPGLGSLWLYDFSSGHTDFRDVKINRYSAAASSNVLVPPWRYLLFCSVLFCSVLFCSVWSAQWSVILWIQLITKPLVSTPTFIY